MRYWDTSAIVPLVVEEPGTRLARSWLREDSHLATWCWTLVEIVSAIERRSREGRISHSERREAIRRFETLSKTWDEVSDALAVRMRAVAVLAREPIRAADAAQLGAALLIAGPDPASLEFVCLDRRLASAAERERFAVLSWPDEDSPEIPGGTAQ